MGSLPLYLNANASIGIGSASVATSYSAPKLISYRLGAVAAWKFLDSWIAGLSTDLGFTNQLSATATAGANYKGHRWNILSPTLGWQKNKFTVLADLQFLGSYSIAENTASGSSVSYSGPLGGRLRGSYNFWDKMDAGLEFSYLTFGTLHDSTAGDTSLLTKEKIWSFGALVSYAF